MRFNEIRQALESVTDAIYQIDQQCCTPLNDIEHGLVNVKLEFRARAMQETNKKLTEERLIAWLVWQKLASAGWRVDWEVPYPGVRKKWCDLVVHVNDASRLWLELKLASKAWFNCEGKPSYANSCYLPYLQGTSRTHSFRHDFKKLQDAKFPDVDCRAICLIGFDCVKAPMDEEVMAVVRNVIYQGKPWNLVTERHWPDRRCADFQISVWHWQLPPTPTLT
jgi:hypothetical protein